MIAWMRPYIARMVPTSARLSLLPFTYVGKVGTYRYSEIQKRNAAAATSSTRERDAAGWPATTRGGTTTDDECSNAISI